MPVRVEASLPSVPGTCRNFGRRLLRSLGTQKREPNCTERRKCANFRTSASSVDVEDHVFSQDDWDSFVQQFSTQHKEHVGFIDQCSVQGSIPKELKGTFLRNGPGMFEIGGKKIPQPFDGDGMVAYFSFPGEGKAPFFANRFVRTEAFLREQKAGKMLYRGAFSVGNPSEGWFWNPLDMSVKKIANTGVVLWGGRLLALYERDLPYELSLPGLETLGLTQCDGAIQGPYFGAHYRIFGESDGSKRLIGFCSEEAGLSNKLTISEFDEQWKRLETTEYLAPNAAFGFFHDFAVTADYYVFVENSVELDFGKFCTKYMFGKACIAECLEFVGSRPTKIHIIPRPGRKKGTARVVVSPIPFFSFHHANAYSTSDGTIILDTVANLSGIDFSANLSVGPSYYENDVGRGSLMRFEIDTATGNISYRRLLSRACEFPSTAPAVVGRPHSHIYSVGSRIKGEHGWGAPQVVIKASIQGTDSARELVYCPRDTMWAGEPLFVQRPGATAEDDGWVLVCIFDSEEFTTDLHILEAQTMEMVAKISAPCMLPSGLHGSWTNEYVGPLSERGWEMKCFDVREHIL